MEDLVFVLGCRVGKLPTTYLGLPLGASFKSTSMWYPMKEKFQKRLVT